MVTIFCDFQAEDGIRDLTVTGVQTCALPICKGRTVHGEVGLIQQGRMELAAVLEGVGVADVEQQLPFHRAIRPNSRRHALRSEEHTSELQSQSNLVCRLLLEKKKTESRT